MAVSKAKKLEMGVYLYRGWTITHDLIQRAWAVEMPDGTFMSYESTLGDAKEYIDDYITWHYKEAYNGY